MRKWESRTAGTLRWGSTKHAKSTKDSGKGRDNPRRNPLTGLLELRKPMEISVVPSDSRSFASFVGTSSASFRLGKVPGGV